MYESLVESMNTSIRREIGAIISKIHRVDLGKPNSEIGGPSFYVRDLTDKLSFIRTEVLSRYNLEEASRAWYDLYLPYASL